ncbi:MAG: GHKL domain-containing protein [Ruminococcus sp.]|nr:GHKL domain-containing protein [Ruminococcus sp.]
MILKKRASRIIAFIISCVLVGASLIQFIFLVNKNMSEVEERNERNDVISSFGYTNEMIKLFDQLWAVGNIYLRNTNSSNVYTCNKYREESVKQALRSLGIADSSGTPVINNPLGFEYYLSCGDNVRTNTGKSKEELAGAYSIQYDKGIDDYDTAGLNWHYNTDKYWYTTNYGMTFYRMYGSLPKSTVVLYDFDTTGLDSYRDRNGAVVYYKTDGTTPVPDELRKSGEEFVPADQEAYEAFNPEYSTEPVTEPTTVIATTVTESTSEYAAVSTQTTTDSGSAATAQTTSEVTVTALTSLTSAAAESRPVYEGDIAEVTDTEAYMFYDADSGSWYKVSKDSFKEFDGDNSDITIYIKPSDELIAEYEGYHEHRSKVEADSVHKAIPLAALGIAGAVIGLVLLFCCGYSAEKKKFVLSAPDNIIAEIPLAMIIASCVGVFAMFCGGIEEIRASLNDYYSGIDMGGIIAGSMITVCYAIGLGSLITLVTRLKCRSLLKTSLTGRICAFLWRYFKRTASRIKDILKKRSVRHIERDALRKDLFLRRFIIRTAAALIIGAIVFVGTVPDSQYGMFILLSILILAVYLVLSLRDYEEIAGIAKQISDMNGGDYSPRTVPEKSPAYGMTNNLNNISDGIRSAVDRQVQSERMKVELVTNVSHDLKTPLTSIISYIDLLSAEEMSPAAKDYVSVISQKSERLKVMVADLFDLAKATSHTDVNSEQIDAVILTQQVIGDMADRISQSGMEVRTDIKAQTAPIMADGKKLYRVLQNLIDNALKYSMAGTRIYVALENNAGYTNIAVKNISAEEMDFTPEEITERFTRGDRSRTTEGNGLGLSIAKSFTEACGGTFEIIIDGDMFTAHVKLPLIRQ